MPTYDYKCQECGEVKEVFHWIREIENPDPDTLEKITCHGLMQRIPVEPQLMGFNSHGQSVSSSEMLKDKQKMLKKRSTLHFKNTIDENKKLSDAEKKRWKNQLKDLPKGDHEKMK